MSSSSQCVLDGNADMYGLGIRLGFYLLWFSGILSNLLFIRDEITASRFALASLITATFIALIVQTVRGSLTAVDIYIICLMSFGSNYFLIPTFLWRAATCFKPKLDPTRWTVVTHSEVFRLFSSILLMATSSFQTWFWVSGVFKLGAGCQSYGFLFKKLPLSGPVIRYVNIAFLSLLLLIAILHPLQYFVPRFCAPSGYRKPEMIM